jgi:predicted esterase
VTGESVSGRSSAGGTESFVHRYVPAAAGAPPVTLLLLHGTGGSEDDLIPLGRALAPGAGVLSPRGKVLERGMPRFFRRLAEGVFDLEDLVARTHELADFVTASSVRYGFDPHNIIAAGFSNGANIAASLLLLHPRLLRGAVLFRPMVPFVPPALPDLTGVSVFVGAGRADPLVAPAETERLVTLLQTAGAAVIVHWDPSGHGLAAGEVAAATAWLRRCLVTPPPGSYTTDAQ